MEPEIHEKYILPPEMWNMVFSYLDLQSKQISRTVCSTWKHIINSPNQWSMYVPRITKNWLSSSTILLHLSTELIHGRYRKCRELRYYSDLLLEVSGLYLHYKALRDQPELVSTKCYVALHPKEIMEDLEETVMKLFTIEVKTNSCYKDRPTTPSPLYRIGKILDYDWKLQFRIKIGNNPTEEAEMRCGTCQKEKNECTKQSNIIGRPSTSLRYDKSGTSLLFIHKGTELRGKN